MGDAKTVKVTNIDLQMTVPTSVSLHLSEINHFRTDSFLHVSGSIEPSSLAETSEYFPQLYFHK